jgi:exopolyphosphatase/guanosine-5'-triphosphate,3'-diphosphate pyrophosphatase
MRIAAIDLGSNSIHMVVVEVGASGGLHVIGREKEMVRLGAGTLARGRLTAAAGARALGTLRKFKRLAEAQGAERIVAVATAALREAGNGEEFLAQVARETGIRSEILAGEEEARLIYLAALHSIHLAGRRALVLDIGGGSVELALGAGERLEWGVSEKLGVLRLAERFARSDPMSPAEESRLADHVAAAIEPHAERARKAGFELAVGTSGTVLALGALAHALEAGSAASRTLHHVVVSAESLRRLRRRLSGSSMKDRRGWPGLDPARADIIVVGAVILEVVLERLGVQELTLCEWALREGVLLDAIQAPRRALARASSYPDVRRRSVASLAERCGGDAVHGRQVARLALALFDVTKLHHGLGETERALLEYAALLHDAGRHISYAGHHKHSYYVVRNGGLRGFHPEEIEVLASVARYHRRGRPSKRHAAFAGLPRRWRRVVRTLAGMLRVADALDRDHRQSVRSLSVAGRRGALLVQAAVPDDEAAQTWAMGERTALLERALGRPIRVQIVPEAAPEAKVAESAGDWRRP